MMPSSGVIHQAWGAQMERKLSVVWGAGDNGEMGLSLNYLWEIHTRTWSM